jgi:dipeptidyl aminopeptidase/acylaminoacyl peptidase
MKTSIKLLVLLFVVCNLVCAQQNAKEFPKLTGPYLGQKPPGNTPEPFAPDIPEIHKELHNVIVFSPDGKEAYWKPVWSPKTPIYVSKMVTGTWSKPEIAFFSDNDQGDDSPCISPDGNRFIFLSRRPTEKNGKSGRDNLWVMEKSSKGWSEPKPLPQALSAIERMHWQISIDKQGNLYFGTSRTSHTEGYIYCSKYNGGNYSKPERLENSVNSVGSYNFSPFVSPDGSYLIFSRETSRTPYQLFISFRKKNGAWSEAINLKERLHCDRCLNGVVTPDEKYFFFCGSGNVPFWVDASFIKELRPKE